MPPVVAVAAAQTVQPVVELAVALLAVLVAEQLAELLVLPVDSYIKIILIILYERTVLYDVLFLFIFTCKL